MARVTRIPLGSRQYVAFPVLLGIADASTATVEVSISPVTDWGATPAPTFSPAEWGTDGATVQVLVGPSTSHPLPIGLYRITWRVTAGSESTIVAGERYLEIY